jgi:uncharacterized cupredoxin-like copper-binding protein
MDATSTPAPAASPRRPGRLSLVGGIVLALGVAGVAAAWVGLPTGGRTSATTKAVIGIHYSHFTPSEVIATAGVPITITLINTDPIDHEWLVGDAAFHERHRTGTEAHHGARPTEVSLSPGTTVTTTVVFDQPGDYQYICHLPGHEAYGMVGVLRVLPAS